MNNRPESEQEIFDFVVNHLRAQRVPSANSTGCMYRGPNGTKCAVGCLIPDAFYKPHIEHKAAHASEVKAILKEIGYNGHEIYFIGALQRIHDMWANPLCGGEAEEWGVTQEEIIKKFAASQSLTYTGVNK
jgi:hypothetical protein